MPNAEFLVNVGVKLDKSSLESLKKQITDADIKPLEIDIKFKSDKLQKELNILRKDLQEILKISTQIGKSGFGSVGGATKGIKSATNEYLKLYREHANLQKLRLKLIDDKDINGVKVVEEMMRRLGKDLTAYEKQLGKTGLASVAKEVERIERGLTVAQAKFRDSSNTKEMDAFLSKYKELTDLRKRKANLIDDKDIEQAKQLEREISKVKSELKEMGSAFTVADFTPDIKAKMQAMGQAVKMEIAKVTDKANAQAVKDQQKVIDAQVNGVLESRKKLASLQNDELKLIWADGTKEELGKVRKEIDKAFKDFQSKRSELNKLGKEMGQDLFAPIQSQLDEFDRNYARQTAKTDDIVKTKWWDSQAKQQQAEVKAYVDSIKEYQTKMKDLLSLKVNGKEGTEEFALLKKEVDEARLSVEQMGKALTHKYGESVFDEYNDELNKLEANIQRIEAKAKDDMMGKQYAQGLQEYKKGIKELVDLQIKADKALQEGEGGQAKFERYSQQIEGVKAKLKSVATEMAQTFGKDFLAPIQSEILKSTNKLADFRVDSRNVEVMKDQNRALEQYKKNVQQIITLKKARLDLVDANDAEGVQRVDTLIHQLIGSCKELRTAIPDDMMEGVADSWKSSLNELTKTVATKQKELVKISEEVEKIKGATATAQRATNMTNLESRWNKLSESVRGTSRALDEAKKAQANLNKALDSGDSNKIIQAYKEYAEQVKITDSAIRQMEIHQRALNDEQALNKRRDTLSQNIDKWLSYNSGASEKFKNQMRDIQRQLKSVDATRLNHLEAEFRRLDTQAEMAGQKVMSFGDRLKLQISRFGAYLSVSQAIMAVGRGAREAFENVKNLDSAMTELKKVTDETDATYANFLQSAKSKAIDLSTTMTDFINSTADFARLGYSFTEAQDLASVASKYNVVGDNLESIDEATGHLISTMRAFQMESSDAISIVDKLNEVSNNFAVTSGDLGSGLEVASSALATAGNDLDQTIALITGGTEITQDANSTARGIRTIALRIRGMDKELEELGEDTDGMIKYTPKLRKELQDMAGVDIMDGTGQSLRDTYDILGDLAHRWKDLNDVQRAGLTESLAGKNRANVFNALMTNWSQVESAYETAKNSAGSADAEFERYQDSIQAKLNQLKASLEGLSESVLDSEFLKGAIDGLRKFVEVIDFVLDKIGMFPILLSGAFTAWSFKNSKEIWNPIVNSALSAGAESGVKYTGLFKKALNQLSDGNWFVDLERGAEASGAKSAEGFKNKFSRRMSGFGRMFLNLTFGKTNLLSNSASQSFSAIGNIQDIFSKFQSGAIDSEKAIAGVSKEFSRLSSTAVSALGNCDVHLESMKNSLKDGGDSAKEMARSIQTGFDSYRDTKISNIASQKNLSSLKALVDEFNGKTNQFGLSQIELGEKVSQSWGSVGKTMIDVAKSSDQTTISFGKIAMSEMKVKAETVALKGAFITLQSIGMMAIMSLASMAFSKIMEVVQYSKNQRAEARDTAKDVADSLTSVSSAYQEFINVRYAYKEGTASKEELTNASNTLSDALGLEKKQVRSLIDEYDTLDNGLQKVMEGSRGMATSISESRAKIEAGVNALTKDINKAELYNFGLIYDQKRMSNFSKDIGELIDKSKTYQKLVSQGKMFDTKDMNFLGLGDERKSNADEIIKRYEDAIKLITTYDAMSEKDKKKYKGDYEASLDYINKAKDGYDELNKLKQASLDMDLDDSFGKGISKGLPKTQKEFDDLRKSMISAVQADENFTFSQEDATYAVDAFLGSISSMTNYLEASELGYEGLIANIDNVKESIDALNTAMEESVSGSGLTTESIDKIGTAFAGLESYDPEKLFERTANGISLNTDELQRLQAEQSKLKLKELNDDLERMTKLKELAVKAGDKKGIEWYDQQISKCKDLISQYEGLTSTYTKWKQAMSSANEGAMYEDIASQLENIKELRDKGLIGTDDFKTFVEFMGDTTGKTSKQLVDMFDKGYEKMKKFFDGSYEGVESFAKALQGANKEWAKVTDEGWQIDLKNVKLEDVSKKLADQGVYMSEEAIQIMLRRMRDYNWTVDLDIGLEGTIHGEDDIKKKIEESLTHLEEVIKEKGLENDAHTLQYKMELLEAPNNIEEIPKKLEHIKTWLDLLNKDKTVDIDVKDELVDNAKEKVYSLLQLLHDPDMILSIKTENLDENVRVPTERLQSYLKALVDRDYKATIGVDTKDADENLEKTKKALLELSDKQIKDLGITITVDGKDEAIDSAKELKDTLDKTDGKEVKISYTTDDKTKEDTIEQKVEATPDPIEVNVPDSVPVHLEGILSVPALTTPIKVKLEPANVITPKVKTGKAKVNYNKIGKQVKPKTQDTTVNYSKLGKQAKPKPKDTKVSYTKIEKQISPSPKSTRISYTPIKYQEPPADKTAKVSYTITGNGVGGSSGTARATPRSTTKYTNPTSSSRRISGATMANGTAFKSGNWGAKNSGVALMGELGTELLVSFLRSQRIQKCV